MAQLPPLVARAQAARAQAFAELALAHADLCQAIAGAGGARLVRSNRANSSPSAAFRAGMVSPEFPGELARINQVHAEIVATAAGAMRDASTDIHTFISTFSFNQRDDREDFATPDGDGTNVVVENGDATSVDSTVLQTLLESLQTAERDKLHATVALQDLQQQAAFAVRQTLLERADLGTAGVYDDADDSEILNEEMREQLSTLLRKRADADMEVNSILDEIRCELEDSL